MATNMATKKVAAIFLSIIASGAIAETVLPMHQVSVEGVGTAVGNIKVAETPYGLVFTPALQGLAPGLHGFHVHQYPSCESSEKDDVIVPGGAAGGHYDPAGSNAHGAPWGDGHLGDLPPLFVDTDGTSSQPVLAPRLKLADLKGRSLMIHAGGDNHADHPAPLGGGGARVACGVIP